MASRYWVPGGNGNWSSTTNWSTTSGGASGTAAPTSVDDVFVNVSSGTSPVITVDAASNCLSLDFTGAITPTLIGTAALNIFGSLTLVSTLTNSYTGTLSMAATGTGKTITTAGKTLNNLSLNGSGGGWTLQDSLTISGTLTHTRGTFDTNGKTLTCTTYDSNNSNTRSLILGASTVNISQNFLVFTATGFTLSAGTSTINMNGANGFFQGAGATYYNVNGIGAITTITGSNTFNLLTLSSGTTLIVTAGTTQSLLVNFTSRNCTIRSTSSGSAFTISKPSGIVAFRNCSIKDCSAVGGATFNGIGGSINVSGNTGITFGSYVVVEKQLDGRKYVLNSSGVLTAL